MRCTRILCEFCTKDCDNFKEEVAIFWQLTRTFQLIISLVVKWEISILSAVSRSEVCVGRLLAESWSCCVGVCPRTPGCSICACFSSQPVIKAPHALQRSGLCCSIHLFSFLFFNPIICRFFLSCVLLCLKPSCKDGRVNQQGIKMTLKSCQWMQPRWWRYSVCGLIFLFVHTNTELAQVYLLLILSSPWSRQGCRNWNYNPE